MGSISQRARAVVRAASLFVACSSADMAFDAATSPAGAQTLPHLATSRVAVNSVALENAGCPADAPASLAEPVPVDMPEIARQMRVSGTTTLRSDLSSEGRLLGTSVMSSTRNRWLDRAALEWLREERFRAEVRNYRAVAGSYLVDVVFPESEGLDAAT